MKTVKVGIIGAGMIANEAHAGAFGKLPGVEVAAVADVDKSRAEAFAAKHSIPQVFGDYEQMLREVELDAVSVALPVFLHAPATIAALQAGKHVLCEKPMARSREEAQAMVDAAQKSGRKLQVYWRSRFAPEAMHAAKMIAGGELGQIHYVRIVGLRWRGRPGFDPNMASFGKWFGHKKEAGGGTLMDIGGYSIDLVMGLLGFPEVQSASGVTFQGIDRERAATEGYDVEDFAVGLVRLKNGSCINLESSWAANIDGPNGTWIFGTEAGLQLDPLRIFRAGPDGKKVQETVAEEKMEHISPTEQFVQAIRDDTPIRMCSGEEALVVQKIQDALYRSAAEGREVEV